MLDFFNTQVKTNLLHYSTCSGGCNHLIIPFQDKKTFNYTIACAVLTDCASYCKWENRLPSEQKKFLTTADLTYDALNKRWQLPIKSPYNWTLFFNTLEKNDSSKEASDDNLLKAFGAITSPTFENTCQLRRANTEHFYPLYPPSYSKISDSMLAIAEKETDIIKLHEPHIILLESLVIAPEIFIENSTMQKLRIISIKPAYACHYFKKISASRCLDLASVFWQGCGQPYNKIFLIDELHCPQNTYIQMFRSVKSNSDLILKHVLILASKDQYIRIFFSIDDIATMVIASKLDTVTPGTDATIREIVTLSPQVQLKYEEQYARLVKNLVS